MSEFNENIIIKSEKIFAKKLFSESTRSISDEIILWKQNYNDNTIIFY